MIKINCNYDTITIISNISPSLIHKLKTIQNSALRIATGCVKMTSINHLNEETKMIPGHDHIYMISSQYLASTFQLGNPFPKIEYSPTPLIAET